MTPTLSVICGTLNRERSYRRFVESLCRCATVPTELIVSDASDEPYACHIPTPDVDCEVIIEKPRLGHVKGYNQCFRRARGTWVCWMNDDCECLPGWDKIAVDYMAAHPEIGVGCIYFRDNIAAGRGGRFVVQTLYKTVYSNFGVLSREFGNQIGWFDEAMYLYGADTAICYSALEAGKAVLPIPGAKVLHYREMDEVRAGNRVETRQHQDRTIFDQKWKFRAPDLRAFSLRFPQQPLEID